MKRYFLLISLILISVVSAVPTLTFQHEDIVVGETIFGEIKIANGEFTRQIADSDLKFFEGRKEIFLESDIFYYNDSFFFYVYSTRAGNFSIRINDVLFKEDEILRSTTLEKNFNVTPLKNNSDVLTIKPGVVYLEKEPKVTLTNSGNSNLNISYLENKVGLEGGQSKTINYNPKTNFSYLVVKSYKTFSVPVIHFINNSTFIVDDKIFLKTNPSFILQNLYTNEKINYTLEIFNFANESISDLKFTSDLDFIEFEKLEGLGNKEVKNISIFFNPKRDGHFKGTTNISYVQSGKKQNTEIYFDLFILPKGSNASFNISDETCEQKSGKVCGLEEICENSSTWTKGGVYCCLGNCKKYNQETPSGSKWIYGILIFAVIVILGIMIYAKYKKTSPKSHEDSLKEISSKFEERMKGK